MLYTVIIREYKRIVSIPLRSDFNYVAFAGCYRAPNVSIPLRSDFNNILKTHFPTCSTTFQSLKGLILTLKVLSIKNVQLVSIPQRSDFNIDAAGKTPTTNLVSIPQRSDFNDITDPRLNLRLSVFQSLKGLILTSYENCIAHPVTSFQSLKGLILTQKRRSNQEPMSSVSIPQRSDFNLNMFCGDCQHYQGFNPSKV